MKKVFDSLLLIAIAMAMMGLAVTQARADRITLNGGSDGLPPATRVSAEQLGGLKNKDLRTSTSVASLSNSILWSFTGTHTTMNPEQLAFPGSSRNGSFSVVADNVASAPSICSASAKAGTLQANGVPSSRAETAPNIVGGPAGPESTTMLLFGTGLVGAAALLRKRLRDRREESK